MKDGFKWAREMDGSSAKSNDCFSREPQQPHVSSQSSVTLFPGESISLSLASEGTTHMIH